jgi:hypothetical protein
MHFEKVPQVTQKGEFTTRINFITDTGVYGEERVKNANRIWCEPAFTMYLLLPSHTLSISF